MRTVRDFAQELGVERIIERAITFHTELPGTRPSLWDIPVDWFINMTRAAGNAHSQKGIKLNPALRNHGPSALRETFLHEVAHIMQHIVYGRMDHGATWWEMMHQLGQKPTRTHCMNLQASSQTTKLNPDDLGL